MPTVSDDRNDNLSVLLFIGEDALEAVGESVEVVIFADFGLEEARLDGGRGLCAHHKARFSVEEVVALGRLGHHDVECGRVLLLECRTGGAI